MVSKRNLLVVDERAPEACESAPEDDAVDVSDMRLLLDLSTTVAMGVEAIPGEKWLSS